MAFRFILLALIIGITALCWKYFDAHNADTPFQVDLVTLDQDTIDAIEIRHKLSADTLLIKREGTQWVGTLGTNSFFVRKELVDSLLTPIKQISSKGLFEPPASISMAKQSIDLRFFSSGQELVAFSLSEFPAEHTLLQFKGKSEVFEVDEHIWPYYDRPISNYRVDDFIEFSSTEVTALGFSFEPNTIFTLRKDSLGWTGLETESDWVGSWLKGIENLDGKAFADQFDPIASSGLLYCSIDLRFDESETPLQIFIYRDTSGVSDFVLNSSQYPTHFFWSDSTGLFQQLVPAAFRESEILIPE